MSVHECSCTGGVVVQFMPVDGVSGPVDFSCQGSIPVDGVFGPVDDR